MNFPIIKPFKSKEYKLTQSKYDNVPKLPMRMIMVAPSNSGKSVLISNLILNIYRDCFDQVYIFSPSIMIDDNFIPVRKYLDEKNKKINDKIYFETYQPQELNNIIENQEKVIEFQKKHDHNKLFQILIVLDDVADDRTLCRNSSILNGLAMRGRHRNISLIISVQYYTALNKCIRCQSSSLILFQIKNYKDIETFLEEIGGLFKNKNKLFQIYKLAIEDEPYSFLYVNLASKDINKTFYVRFEEPIHVTEDD